MSGASSFRAGEQGETGRRSREAAELVVQGRRTLVLFDEVFRGTNVKDALEASARVINGFTRARHSGFIFSSHLSELADVIEDTDRVRFAFFEGEIRSGVPYYSYRLREGVSDTRLGLALLRRSGIPDLMARLASQSGA